MAENTYTADNMRQVKGLEIIRMRQGMYIGGSDSNALMHLLWEALDNAVDEHLVGYGSQIDITLHEDGAIQVDDYARGIPTGINKETGQSGLQMAFGLHSGGKFDQNAYAVSGGLNGVGIAAIAALSNRVDGIVYQNKKEHVIQFKQGVEGTFSGEGEFSDFTPQEGIDSHRDPRTPAEKKARPTGTTIKFYPDYDCFDSGDDEAPRAEWDIKRILRRAENTCYLSPNLTINVKDDRFTHQEYSFHYPNGLNDMLSRMAETPMLGEPIIFDGKTSFTTKGVEKTLYLDIAIQWEQGFDHSTASFVNIIETSLGGTHVTGAQKGIEEAVVEALHNKNMIKAKDPTPEIVDIAEGLNLIVSVKLPEPGYSAQTKERLTEAGASTATKRIVLEYLTEWFGNRRNASTTKDVLEKIMSAAKARKAKNAQFDISDVMAEADKESIFSQMPENLRECRKVGDPRSSLTLVEGDSALGNMLIARNSELQALFPLKGKPLNVHGLKPSSLFIPPKIHNPKTPQEKRLDRERKKFLDAGHILLQNRELDDLVKSIGAGFGETFKIEDMRYHDIVIASDADPDGGHIYSLLVGFFYLYMRPIIQEGRLYKTIPPLFVIKSGKESKPNMSFAANDSEKDRIVAELKAKKEKIIHIGRRKGLGEMNVDEVEDHLLSPKTRRLRRVTLFDGQDAISMIDITLGPDPAARKEWLSRPETIKLLEQDGS